ncbi:MAG: MFS transporter [Betaproteobacteria bacterium]
MRESSSTPTPIDASDAAATRAAFRLVFPGVMVAMFLAAADQTILASALPSIASEQGALADLSWVVVGYLLAATVAAPLYGYLGDRYGRRQMLLMALAVFTIASVACVLAPNFLWLVLFRALQGLGGGGLMTLAQALIGEHVSPRERGRFAGYFATVFALASTSGPVLGAYLTEQFGWRAVFVVNVPLGLLAALLALRIPVPPKIPAPHIKTLDVVGAILFSVAITCLLFALTSGGHRFPWWSWPMGAMVGAACAGFALLLAWESRHPDPVISIRLLALPAIGRSDAVVLCFAAIMFPFILYLPLYLQMARGIGIGASGASLLPITLAQVITSATTGRLVTKTGRVNIFPIVGLSLAMLALLGLAITVHTAPLPVFVALTMAVGMGLGMVMPPTQVTVQMAAGREALGSATGLISLSRALGGACGVAVIGVVLFALIDAPADGAATALHQALEGGPAAVAAMPGALRTELAGRVGDAYRAVFLVLAGMAAIGAWIATTIPKSDWTK